MGVGQLKIVLDNSAGVFFPGETINGTFRIIIINKPEKYESISLEGKGLAHVKFISKSQKSNFVEDTEKYFKIVHPLVTPPHGTVKLPVGRHEFPFSLTLPLNIPSSFEGQYGYIRYTLTGSLFRRLEKFVGKIGFTVNNIVDLNIIPMARMPVSSTVSKSFGLFIFKSEPVTAKAWISQPGCIPGQTVLFNAEVKNPTGRKMQGSRVKLEELSVFRTQYSGIEKSYRRIIVEKRHGEFENSDVWKDEPFLIPGLAPSTLPHCNIIHIEYSFQLEVETDGILLKCPLHIIVGNVPVLPVTPAITNNPDSPPVYEVPSPVRKSSDSGNVVQNPRKLQSSISVDYPELAPLRYEECFFRTTPNINRQDTVDPGVNVNDRTDDEFSETYAPRYATYSPPNPPISE